MSSSNRWPTAARTSPLVHHLSCRAGSVSTFQTADGGWKQTCSNSIAAGSFGRVVRVAARRADPHVRPSRALLPSERPERRAHRSPGEDCLATLRPWDAYPSLQKLHALLDRRATGRSCRISCAWLPAPSISDRRRQPVDWRRIPSVAPAQPPLVPSSLSAGIYQHPREQDVHTSRRSHALDRTAIALPVAGEHLIAHLLPSQCQRATR